jgi:hypothetical protein
MCRLLAKELDYAISEWTEPTNVAWKNVEGEFLGDDGSAQLYNSSRNKQFSDFLYQTRCYPDLTRTEKNRLVVVKESPDAMELKFRRKFWETIEDYAQKGRNPMIIMITSGGLLS